MRLHYSLLLLAFIVVSCTGGTNRAEKQKAKASESVNQRYYSAIENAEAAPISDTTFFLGYQMGMSSAEVLAQSKRLVTDKKLKKTGNNYFYIYKSPKIDTDYLLQLGFEYYNDELYQLTLKFTGKRSDGRTYISGIMGDLALIEFMDFCKILEGLNYKPLFYENSATGKTEKSMLRGNIEVRQGYESFVFTDLYRSHCKREKQEENAQSELMKDISM